MASTSKQQQQPPTSSKNTATTLTAATSTITTAENETSEKNKTSPDEELVIPPPPQDVYLSKSTHLTRKEVIRRRLHRSRQLSKCYRAHYWSLMEELRVRYRDYCWKFGTSPFEQPRMKTENETDVMMTGVGIEGSGENDEGNTAANGAVAINGNGNASINDGGGVGVNGDGGGDGNFKQCSYAGCKLKAMALTSFCHLHILSDANQKLYKSCNYVLKSAQAGPIVCGKPILRSSSPSVCQTHLQKAHQQISRALKKFGLNVTTSNKVAPKFHHILAEFTRQIQNKRRRSPSPKVKIEEMLEDQKPHSEDV